MSHEIDNIIDCLSLEEKVGLLSAADWWRTLRIERDGLFVPPIKTTDGPNGARGESYVSGIRAACFPCSTCMGATFDVDLLCRLGQAIAIEAKSKSANVLLAPTMNVIRSPLGGRNYETYSEDPYVLGTLGAAFVNGCQSQGIAATPKHFVANDTERRRTELSAEIDEQTLREIYLLPFQIVMKLSDPWCFMTCYNRVNGTYVADDARLIEGVLRGEWNFGGLVISDWMGTYSTAKSLNAGMDLEMPGPTRWRGTKLLEAVASGAVSISTLDRSVKRILNLASRLGLSRSSKEAPEIARLDEGRDRFIANSAAEGMVLLKNEKQVLPLHKGSSVALIGHHAKYPSIGGGGSAKVLSIRSVSVLEALKSTDIQYTYSPGVPVFAAVPQTSESILSSISESAATKVPVLLEWFNGNQPGKNKVHEEYVVQPEYMIKEAWPSFLAEEYCTRMTFQLTPETSGEHLFSIVTTGIADVYVEEELVYHRPQEPVLEPESFYFYKAKIEHRFRIPMQQGQKVKVRVDSWAADKDVLIAVGGKVFQGSSLRFLEHVDIPQAIEDAAKSAANADVAVVCVGTTNEIESEGYDRETMDLTSDQYKLILAVAQANPRTVVVNFSGSPTTVSPYIDEVSGLLQAWFPGQECGTSVLKILTGEICPSGRLPMSWPKKNEDNPAYGNFPCDEHDIIRYEERLSVGYRYYDRSDTPVPQFPFGFGLSYTTFSLSDLQPATPNDSQFTDTHPVVRLSFNIHNLGHRAGKAVVQFYVSKIVEDRPGNLRPVKELKAFSKVDLPAGCTEQEFVQLDKYAFSVYDAELQKWRIFAGRYVVAAGFSSVDIVASVTIEVTQTMSWAGV